MEHFRFQGQVNQDEFAFNITGKRNIGTFVDIGSSYPILTSNTWFLEKIGWTGVCIDKVDYGYSERTCRFVEANALELNYSNLFEESKLPKVIDYLSLDIDEETFACLALLPLDEYRFKAITIEHDHYRFGNTLRTPQRDLLSKHGYELYIPDVACNGLVFEDWWIHPDLVFSK